MRGERWSFLGAQLVDLWRKAEGDKQSGLYGPLSLSPVKITWRDTALDDIMAYYLSQF